MTIVGRIGTTIPKGNVRSSRQLDGLRPGHGPDIGIRQIGEFGLDGFEYFLHNGESRVGVVTDFGFKALMRRWKGDERAVKRHDPAQEECEGDPNWIRMNPQGL